MASPIARAKAWAVSELPTSSGLRLAHFSWRRLVALIIIDFTALSLVSASRTWTTSCLSLACVTSLEGLDFSGSGILKNQKFQSPYLTFVGIPGSWALGLVTLAVHCRGVTVQWEEGSESRVWILARA